MQTAFAAIDRNDKSAHIAAWTIKGTAKLVREAVGETWLNGNHSEGWKAAKIEGMKVVKINIKVLKG